MSNTRITIEYLKELDACQDGLDNVIKHYPNCDMLMSKFLALEKVSYADKTWLIEKVVNVNTLQIWAVECAENVLHIFENKYPNDKRVRECIKATKLYISGECSKEYLMEKRNAACIGYSDAAYAANAANAAADAAYYTDAAADAADAADASFGAAYATSNAAYAAKLDQQDITLSLLISLIENEGD